MLSNELVCKILDYIDDNIFKNITIDEISRAFAYNRFYIMRLFKKEMGVTIINYINKIKIYNSISLLKKKNNLLKVAFDSGFNSEEYYSEIFKKEMNVNPKTFRKFLRLDRDILLEDFVACTNSLGNLKQFIKDKEKYKERKIPTNVHKSVLTIFK